MEMHQPDLTTRDLVKDQHEDGARGQGGFTAPQAS